MTEADISKYLIEEAGQSLVQSALKCAKLKMPLDQVIQTVVVIYKSEGNEVHIETNVSMEDILKHGGRN
ncbi:MAG: hypothetical protein PVG39_31720 [Desulfobacteraceae bacterium]|jgi:hypothetical protein